MQKNQDLTSQMQQINEANTHLRNQNERILKMGEMEGERFKQMQQQIDDLSTMLEDERREAHSKQ